ncbi:hypothetical protein [Halobacillus sp. A5]|uniref:hypothetical protein n=1 Tax=Halobacillus sp. A5 TaxID=2880263 RepID=UPI0020A6533E|nr:hypothetical protein [Halobacillus sp. A5]MCP3028459.1 hypothetical protein [Halobacillus sp. A5]
MRFFVNLNVLSALYAFILFLAVEILLNIGRLSRLTGWEMDAAAIGGMGLFIFACIAFTLLFYQLIKRLMENRKASFWSVLLWVPYFLLFIFAFVSLFPITNPADEPADATGLIIIFMVCFYPVYLLVLHVFGTGVGITDD